nr:hypothetical protein [Nocardia alba]
MLDLTHDQIRYRGDETRCVVDRACTAEAPDNDQSAAGGQKSVQITQGIDQRKVVQGSDQRDGLPLARRSELIEPNLLDHNGIVPGETSGRYARGRGVGLDPSHPIDMCPYPIDEIACATADIEQTFCSARPHLMDNPPAVQVVVTPRMPLVEAIDARRQGHDTTVATDESFDGVTRCAGVKPR